MIARYRSGPTLAIGWALIGMALVIIYAMTQRGFSVVASSAAILISLFAWLVAIRPAILVFEDSLTIQNVFKKYEIPWAAITQISAPLLLSIRTEDGRKISAWAISSSGSDRARGRESRGEAIAVELERYRTAYRS
jgi:hypothetical protein